MMKYRNGLIRLALAPLLACLCYRSSLAADAASAPKFDAMIANIEKTVVDLTSIGDLFRSKDFKSIYAHPKNYYADMISFLKKKGLSDQKKLIAIYTMRRLPLQDYLKLLNSLLFMYRKGIISYQVYSGGAIPATDWNTVLQDHYRDPAVQAFLKMAKSSATTQEDKDYIDSILSGEAARHVQERRADGTLKQAPSDQ